MKDTALVSPPQRAVALTEIAKTYFKPENINQVLDEPVEKFGGASPIQHARKGIPEFREAEQYLLAGIVYA